MKLKENPFLILQVGPEATRTDIAGAAQALDLEEGGSRGREARRILITPRLRVQAEAAWVWSTGGATTPTAVTELVQSGGCGGEVWQRASPLGRLNASVAALDIRRTIFEEQGLLVSWTEPTDTILERMDMYAQVIEWKSVREHINATRKTAGFTPLQEDQALRKAIKQQIGDAVTAVKETLNERGSSHLVTTMTKLVDEATHKGEGRSGPLIVRLIEQYEVEAQQFFECEDNTMEALKTRIRKRAKNGASDTVITGDVQVLMRVLNNWDKVAQPIQISKRSRGQRHEYSYETAKGIRDLSIELWNERDLRTAPRLIVREMQSIFAEEREMMEILTKDIETMGQGDLPRSSDRNTEPRANSAMGWKGLVKLATTAEQLKEGRETPKAQACPQRQKRTAPATGRQQKRDRPYGAEHRQEIKAGWWWLAPIGLLVLIMVWSTTEETNGGSGRAQRTPSPEQAPRTMITPNPSGNTAQTPPETGIGLDALSFTKPRPGVGHVLNTSEIRWCIREGLRIERYRPSAQSDHQITRFNAMVGDYNSRCGNYQYRPSAQNRAEQDIERHKQEILRKMRPPW